MDATEKTDGAARKSADWGYGSFVDEETSEIWSWCEAVIDFSKVNRDAADFKDYSITLNTYIYKTDDTWINPTLAMDASYTLAEPDYEDIFTSEAEEFEYYEEEVMNESRDFDLSDFDPNATGTAFQKFSGGFVFYPNFLTSAFRFKWVLEMPSETYLDL